MLEFDAGVLGRELPISFDQIHDSITGEPHPARKDQPSADAPRGTAAGAACVRARTTGDVRPYDGKIAVKRDI
jgi:hypothetical protein